MFRKLREAGLVVGAQIAGQLALLLVIPVLTRIFDPAQYGIYQIALALSLVVQPLATLRLEFIIPVTRDARLARARYRAAAVATIASTTVLCVVAGVLGFTESYALADIFFMIGVLLLVNAWTLIDNARLIRGGFTGRLALRNFLSGGLAALLQLFVGLLAPDVTLLAIALLASRAVAILITRSRGSVQAGANQRSPINTDDRYGPRRALTTVAAGVISNSSVYGLTLVGGLAYGPAVGGQISVAQRVTSTPVSMAGQALSQYFQTRASRVIRARSANLTKTIVYFVLGLAVFVAPVVVAMMVLGPILAVPILGEGWQPAGYVIAILAVPTGMQLIVSPTVPLLVMLGREKLLLGMQVARLTLSLAAALIPAAISHDFILSCIGFAVTTTASYLATLALTLHAARGDDAASGADGA